MDSNPTADTSVKQSEAQQGFNISDWKKKFQASEKVMKSEFIHKYKLAKSRLRSEYEIKGRGSRKMTHDNVSLVYSIGQSFVSSVYFKTPNCNLTAREEVDHLQVENTEIKVNDWLKDKKVKKVVKRIIWDAYLGGFGARFIDKVYQDVEDPNNVLVPEIPTQLDEMGQEIVPGQPAQYGRIVLKDEITITRIRPDLVRFPKGFDFDNAEDSPWVGFRAITPIEEVKDNENWDQKVRESIEGQKYSTLSDEESKGADDGGNDLYAAIDYVLIKPANALENWKLLIFCEKCESAPLQVIDFDKGTIGCPLKFLYFNPLDDDCSYPNGDPWNFESQLNAVDTWWKKMRRHVEKSNPKRVYDSGSITPQEMQKMKSNNDLEWVGVENKQRRPISDLVQTLESAQVHPDVSRFYEVARELISELAPRSGLARGAEDQKVDTATEAKIINTGEVIDLESRIDDVRGFIEDIVLDVAGILEKSQDAELSLTRPVRDLTGAEVIDPITGKPKSEVVQVNKTGFTSKIKVDVDVESMQAQNKDVFRRQLLESLKLFQVFKPFFDLMRIMPDPKFWTEKVMETMNVRNIDKGFIPMPPMAMVDPKTGQPMGGPMPQEGMMPEEQMAQEDAMAGHV